MKPTYLLVVTTRGSIRSYVGPFTSFSLAKRYGDEKLESDETYSVENLYSPEE